MGELKADLMSKCPEELEEDLNYFIDYIGYKLKDIEAAMTVTNLSALGNLSDAHKMLQALIEDIY